jgi:small subunit ribosomal protein S6
MLFRRNLQASIACWNSKQSRSVVDTLRDWLSVAMRKLFASITVKLDKYAAQYAEKRRNKLSKKEEA